MNPQAIVAILLTLIVAVLAIGFTYKGLVTQGWDENVIDHWKTVLSIIVGGLIAYIGITNK